MLGFEGGILHVDGVVITHHAILSEELQLPHIKSLVVLSQLQNCAVEGFFPRRGRKKGGKSGYRQLKAGKMKGLATIHSDTQDEYYL